MPPLTEVAATTDAIKQRLGPAIEEFDEKVRQAKRVITRAQHAAEDGVGATVVQTSAEGRRHCGRPWRVRRRSVRCRLEPLDSSRELLNPDGPPVIWRKMMSLSGKAAP